MRIVFCGTPLFAVPALQAVLAAGHEVPLVVAQPDRPVGRKQTLTAPAVKQAAIAAGIAVAQPEKIRNNEELQRQLEKIAPDAIVVVAYGRIIPPWMLCLPRFGNVNVHASLLPKYRGAAPIQWALANGEKETGVTTMLLDEGLDTGPIVSQRSLSISKEETAVELSPRLAHIGAELLIETLRELHAGSANPKAQDDAQATLAPVLTREDGHVDFRRDAQENYNRWRGFQPWPGAFAFLLSERIAFTKIRMVDQRTTNVPGTIESSGEHLYVACGGGTCLELLELQLAGKRTMPAAEFLRGHPTITGERLS